MGLTNDLIAQFVRVTNDNAKTKKEDSIVYGTVTIQNGTPYVKIDGSELPTPITTTADVRDGERVTVMIKNHTATVTGNMTSPAARVGDVKNIVDNSQEAKDKIALFEVAIANTVSTEQLNAEKARIDALHTDTVTIKEQLTARNAEIDTLIADNVNINKNLTAASADIESLKTNKLDVIVAEATYATIENLSATDAKIHNLEATYGEFASLTAGRLDAFDATILELDTGKLSATDADLKYANIDFANINTAAIEKIFADTGLIENIMVGDGTITGRLVGVTISGDLIEGNTVKAEKLVIKGSDGLYYKLNTDGMKVEAEQTDQNSLNGSVIKAKSITATKISVTDLVAFGATIGGFKISDNSIYSEPKSSVNNTARGIYFDKDGQIAIGDANNYLKYYKTDTGNYKLEISSVDNLTIGGRNLFGFNKNIELTPLANSEYAEPVFDEYNKGFTITIKKDTPATTIITRGHRLGFNGVEGESYSFSARVYASVDNIHISLDVCDQGNYIHTIGTEPQKISFSVIPTDHYTNDTYNGFFDVSVPGGYTIPAGTVIHFEYVKVERGNRVTDWTPAPEDLATSKSLNTVATNFESKIQQTSQSIMSSVSSTYATKDTVDNLEVGGRNLVLNTATHLVAEAVDEATKYDVSRLYSFNSEILNDPKAFLLSVKDSYLALSYDIEVEKIAKHADLSLNRVGGYFTFNITDDETGTKVAWYGTHSSGLIANNNDLESANSLISIGDTETSFVGHYAGYCDMANGPTILKSFYANPDKYSVTASGVYVEIRGLTAGGVIKNVKFEVGNKPTRWSPAPEDMATGKDVDAAQNTANEAKESVRNAETLIAQLSESISMLVTDGNGTSLMTQTENGWMFSTADLQDLINSTSEGLNSLTNDVGDVNNTVDILQQAVKDLGTIAEYVKIGTYEDEPCIELGEADSEFKLRITNTRIMFMEGSSVPAYINNQSLYINKAVVEEELYQGGFVWKARSNGNLGLVWKGVNS